MVRELVEGRSLADLDCTRDGRAPRVALEAIAQAADQLTRLHRALLLHGDLKPANIIVGDDGRATLVDLGLAATWREGGAQARGPHAALRRAGALRGRAAHGPRRGLRARRDARRGARAPRGARLAADVRDALARGRRARHRRRSGRAPPERRRARERPPPRRAARRSRRAGDGGSCGPSPASTRPRAALLAQIAALRGGRRDRRSPGRRSSGRSTLLRRIAWSLGVERPVAWIEAASRGRRRRGARDRARGARGRPARRSPRRWPSSTTPTRSARPSSRGSASARAAGVKLVLVLGARRAASTAIAGPDLRGLRHAAALGRSIAGELVRRTIPSLPDAVVAHVVARAEGWPGRVRAIVARLARAPVVAPEDVDRLLEEDAAPVTGARRPRSASSTAATSTRPPRCWPATRATRSPRSPWPARASAPTAATPRAPSPSSPASQGARADDGGELAVELPPRLRAGPPARGRLRRGRARAAAHAARAPRRRPDPARRAGRSVRAAQALPRRCAASSPSCVAVRGLAQSFAVAPRRGARHARAPPCAWRARRASRASSRSRSGRSRSRCSATTDSTRPRRRTRRRSPPPRRRATPAPSPRRGSTSPASPRRRATSPPPSATSRRRSTWAAARAASPRCARRCSTSPTSTSTSAASRARASRIDALAAERAELPPQPARAAPRARGGATPQRAGDLDGADRLCLAARDGVRGDGPPSTRPRRGSSACSASRARAPRRRRRARARREIAPRRELLGEATAHRALAPLRPRRRRASSPATRPARARRSTRRSRPRRAAGQKEWVWRALDGARASSQREAGQTVAGAPRPRGRARDARGDRRAPPARSARGVLERAAPARRCAPASRARPRPPARRRLARRRRVGEDRLARVLEINRAIAGELDLDRLLERVTDHAIALLGAERGFVILKSGYGRAPAPPTTRGRGAPTRPRRPLHPRLARPVRRRPARALLALGRRAGRRDRRAGRHHRARATTRAWPTTVSVHQLMLQSIACVPIRGAPPAAVIGALYLETRLRPAARFEQELPTLSAFADQVAIAIETARLSARTRGAPTSWSAPTSSSRPRATKLEELLGHRTEQLADDAPRPAAGARRAARPLRLRGPRRHERARCAGSTRSSTA